MSADPKPAPVEPMPPWRVEELGRKYAPDNDDLGWPDEDYARAVSVPRRGEL